MKPDTIAVVGAGMAGLACAAALQQAGCSVTLFDKSRGPGGRLATRRGEGWQCDHGAPLFTARDAAFGAEVGTWAAAGALARWQPRLLGCGGPDGGADWFVGTPGMNSLARHLAQPLHLVAESTVLPLPPRQGSAGWLLACAERGAFGPAFGPAFGTVLLAVPAPQAQPLLAAAAPGLAAVAAAVPMHGCWTLMLTFDAPVAVPFDAVWPEDGVLQQAIRNSSKPGRSGAETWVLHARPAWSQAHIEDTAAAVVPPLLQALAALGAPPPAAWVAHRWRYASTPATPAPVCAWDPALRLGLCGDWLAGGDVQAAWASGRALARQVLSA